MLIFFEAYRHQEDIYYRFELAGTVAAIAWNLVVIGVIIISILYHHNNNKVYIFAWLDFHYLSWFNTL